MSKSNRKSGTPGSAFTPSTPETASTPCPSTPAPSTPTPTTPAVNWETFITPFARAIGDNVANVTTALKRLVGEPSDDAILLLQNEQDTPEEEIQSVLPSVPKAVLRKAVRSLRKTPEASAPVTPVVPASLLQPSESRLPSVPDDTSFLEMLKTGGVLKSDKTSVLSAIKASLAHRAGLYDLPATLIQKMEQHADDLSDPIGTDFFTLRDLLTRHNYAEIFAAIPGSVGTFATQTRKNALLKKLDENFWNELSGFNQQLQQWTESWQKQFANPAAMMGAIASLVGGGAGVGMLPPGMNTPPDTSTLKDAAEAVIDKINKVFSGTGIIVARALAYDAQNIKAVLENTTLPSQIGAANREQMLKMLNADVSSDYVRLEKNITKFALAVMELPNITSGQEELAYLTELMMLGNNIPWAKLSETGMNRPSRTSRL